MFLVLLDPPKRSDGALDEVVAAFQRGEDREQSFQILVERFFRPIHGFFAKRVRSPEDRLDLTQETFFRAYKSLDAFRGDSKLSTWLFRIAFYTYQHYLRTGNLQGGRVPGETVSLSPVDDLDPEQRSVVLRSEAPGADAALLKDEERRLLSEAIRDLPPKMRRSVSLRVYQDRSYQEIADTMGISIQTVKAHLFQARQQLRRRLQDYFDDVDF